MFAHLPCNISFNPQTALRVGVAMVPCAEEHSKIMVLTQAKWQAKDPGTFCEAPTCCMYKVFCAQATKADTREKTGLSSLF